MTSEKIPHEIPFPHAYIHLYLWDILYHASPYFKRCHDIFEFLISIVNVDQDSLHYKIILLCFRKTFIGFNGKETS
jgi:hypothetical protein